MFMEIVDKLTISIMAMLRAWCILLFLGLGLIATAQESEEGKEEINSELTKSFIPTYREYSPQDTARISNVKLPMTEGRKLIFYDNFTDNRHIWSHYQAIDDTLMQICTGFEKTKVCRTKPNSLIDAYTNMENGKKVIFGFTPDVRLRYSNNIPIPLAKNYVVTFNPLSIKQVKKLPSFYYESFNEHTVRIQNSLADKDITIETHVEQAIGRWGLIFGNKLSKDATYYFKLNPDNTYDLEAIYSGNRAKPIGLMHGNLPMNFDAVRKVAIRLESTSKTMYRVRLMANDQEVGRMNISKLELRSMDVGYRIHHSSIEGNNVLVVKDIGVYEHVKPNYLGSKIDFSGAWKGALIRNKKKLYDIHLEIEEHGNGSINGIITFTHHKFKSTVVTKRFTAKRFKHIINFEDKWMSGDGIYSDVVRFSLMQMGHFEIINPDSMIMQSFATNNLHLYGEFDPEFDIHSNRIYLGRVEKTISDNPIVIDLDNENPIVEVIILFEPDSWKISDYKDNTENLDALARSLHRYLAEHPEKVILIHGHTDKGVEQIYSLIRSYNVRNELLKRGIPEVIFCIGHGHSQRISEKKDARNRRVEVELLDIDSAIFKEDKLIMSSPSEASFIKPLPEEFEIQADFRQTAGTHKIVLKNSAGGKLKWTIPNIAGGERQSLRIIKKEDPEDGMMIEFWLDKVRLERRTAADYVSFGMESDQGEIQIENINIFAPK